MPSEFQHDHDITLTKMGALAVRKKEVVRQQNLRAQLGVNFETLLDLTGRSAEDFLRELKNDHDTIEEILHLEDDLDPDPETAPFDRSDIVQEVRTLKNQNQILETWIEQQVEFTLANIPEGKVLRDDQQSALYLMTASTAVRGDTDDFLLKSQRARIGKHLTVPEFYVEEAEEEIDRFHEYVFTNPDILERYARLQKKGEDLGKKERLKFARFHIDVRSKLDGKEAPTIKFEELDDDTLGMARVGETNGKEYILLQSQGQNAYTDLSLQNRLLVINHEYDHFREHEKARNAFAKTSVGGGFDPEEIDEVNAGLVLRFSKETYFTSKKAPYTENESPHISYRNQPKERYADGIGQMWTQAVMDIPRIKNALDAPISMLAGMVHRTEAIERAIEESKNYISDEFSADAKKIVAAMRNPPSSSAYDVLGWAEDVKDKTQNAHQDELETPLTHSLMLASEKLDEIIEQAEKVERIERAIAAKPDLENDYTHT